MYFLFCVVCIYYISVFGFEVSKYGQKRKLGFDFPELELRMEWKLKQVEFSTRHFDYGMCSNYIINFMMVFYLNKN